MNKVIKYIFMLNYKTLFFNLKCLPLHKAIKIPFLINRKVRFINLDGHVEIDAPIRSGMIKIGYGDVAIFDKYKSRSILEIRGKIIFKGEANIGHGTKISVLKNGELTIGRNFNVTAETEIVCEKSIEFGNNTLVSWNNLFLDTDFHFIYDIDGKLINESKKIIIGNDVWIGCRCLVLKGSVVPNGSVIAAGSIVVGELTNENSVFAGNPARNIKNNIRWTP